MTAVLSTIRKSGCRARRVTHGMSIELCRVNTRPAAYSSWCRARVRRARERQRYGNSDRGRLGDDGAGTRRSAAAASGGLRGHGHSRRQTRSSVGEQCVACGLGQLYVATGAVSGGGTVTGERQREHGRNRRAITRIWIAPGTGMTNGRLGQRVTAGRLNELVVLRVRARTWTPARRRMACSSSCPWRGRRADHRQASRKRRSLLRAR